MSTDFRALCAELAAELDHNRRCLLDDASLTHPLADRARAALAEPVADGPAVPEGREPASVVGDPSDEELIDFQNEWFQSGRTEIDVTEFQRATLARWGQPLTPPADRHAAPVPAETLAARPLIERVAAMGDCIGQQTVGQVMSLASRAAAWLAENPPGQPVAIEPRGCPTPGACSCMEPALAKPAAEPLTPPAEGEVAELAAKLRRLAPQNPLGSADPTITRAAELLERHAAPVPVPVNERPWERKGWCDEQGRCWFGREESDNWSADWTLTTTEAVEDFCTYALQTMCLPAHALPLPAPQGGEVEP